LKVATHAAPTLQRFLYDIEIDAGQVKRELEAESGAVRVMTVHGAKGLEAPVVILPDTTAGVEDKPDNGLLFDDDEGPLVSFRSKDDDAKAGGARDAHKARMLGEHWRLLYVAMTRARDRLIVCGGQHGNAKAGEAQESWRAAVETAVRQCGGEAFATPFGEGLRIGALDAAPAPALSHEDAVDLPPAWTRETARDASRFAFAAPSRIARIDPALFSPRSDGDKRFRRGLLIHGLLERLPDAPPKKRMEAALAWLARQGVEGAEAGAFAAEALKIVEDTAFAAVFSARSRAEAPIVGFVGGKTVRGVVDRLVVENDRVIILDFKTDRPAPRDPALAPDAYVLQLALYRDVLRQVFPKKSVTCALLWTEAPHLMELPVERLKAALDTFLSG
jgi:ATP-dependent helicase/nuclease subunit A